MMQFSSNGLQQWKILRNMKSFGTTASEACQQYNYPAKFADEIARLSNEERNVLFTTLDSKYGEKMGKQTESKFVSLLNRQGFFEEKKSYKNLTSFHIGDMVKFNDQIGKIISIRESFVTVKDSAGNIDVFHDAMLETVDCDEDSESKEHKEKPINPNSDDHDDKSDKMITEKNPKVKESKLGLIRNK